MQRKVAEEGEGHDIYPVHTSTQCTVFGLSDRWDAGGRSRRKREGGGEKKKGKSAIPSRMSVFHRTRRVYHCCDGEEKRGGGKFPKKNMGRIILIDCRPTQYIFFTLPPSSRDDGRR